MKTRCASSACATKPEEDTLENPTAIIEAILFVSGDPVRVDVLAHAMNLTVQELEQAGYLEKVSVSGRKEKPLRLTESGKRYTADKLCGLYRAEERAAAAMGAEQFAAIVEMTRKFTDSFEKEIRNGAE